MGSDASNEGTASRRAFLTWFSVAGSAALSALLLLPGASYVLDPLLRPGGRKGRFIRVAELDRLSLEQPVAVPVIGEQVDAWTRAPATRLGTVWLRVLPDRKVVAWNAECPHLGCKIAYQRERAQFGCPCHESAFDLQGKPLGGPSPRSMDPIETRVVDGHVEVRFLRFRAQTKERVEIG
jgi:menaquinol-cytochrome c reductase iron-sulfur subunit